MNERHIEPINAHCHKILPMLYDESLSYYEMICKLAKAFDGLAEDFYNSNFHPTPVKILNETFRFYVDRELGNDANDGRTEATAFRTLDRFLQECDNTKFDVRCYIIRSGLYDVNALSISAIPIHITARVDDVRIRFNQTCAFYDCHLNIGADEGYMLTLEGERIYNDGGSAVFTRCRFKNTYACWGAGVIFRNSEVFYVAGNVSNIVVQSCKLNPNYDESVLWLNDCVTTVFGTGSGYGELSKDSDYPMIFARGGTLAYSVNATLSGEHKYAYAIRAFETNVNITRANALRLKTVGRAWKYGEPSGTSFTNNVLLYEEEVKSGDFSVTLGDSVGNYNLITVRYRNRADLSNDKHLWKSVDFYVNYNAEPGTGVLRDGNASADITFNGKSMVVSNNSGLQFALVLGRNI